MPEWVEKGLGRSQLGSTPEAFAHDQAHDLDSEVWVIRANLGYQVGFLDEMESKHGTLVIAVTRYSP